jgi:hypothetical protein
MVLGQTTTGIAISSLKRSLSALRKMKSVLFALVLCSLIAASFATYGVDVSQETLPSAWSCLKQNGYSFGIVRVCPSFIICPHEFPIRPFHLLVDL